jgi:hypothetical protein
MVKHPPGENKIRPDLTLMTILDGPLLAQSGRKQ